MRIIPVMDLMGGAVVRGGGGRRDEYRPVVSRIASSSDPIDVACAFEAHFGLTELYLADLDAIAGSEPSWDTYRALRAEGFRLWVDAGVRTTAQAADMLAEGVDVVVVGLETAEGPGELGRACELGGSRVAFSLDLRDGRPLRTWPDPFTVRPSRKRKRRSEDTVAYASGSNPDEIACVAVGLGVRRLIVLDLARVGVGGGTGTEALCRHIADRWPEVELIAGGGVRGADDLTRLAAYGVRGALVASALHDGRLSPDQVKMSDVQSPPG